MCFVEAHKGLSIKSKVDLYGSGLKIPVSVPLLFSATREISQVKNQFKNSVLPLDKSGLLAALRSKPFQSAPGRLQFETTFDLNDSIDSLTITGAQKA